MAIKYGKKKRTQSNILYAIITAILISVVFVAMVSTFYRAAQEEAYDTLHLQTKQIKDAIGQQIESDRVSLETMSGFASNLYAHGDNYDRMFEAFEPFGLISNIGILNPDNTFTTKMGSVDLHGKISFEEEAARGAYISGRIPDLTQKGYEIIRSAVPIVVDDTVVGVLYGVIKPETINDRYSQMAQELEAQLFVYDRETLKFTINTVYGPVGDLSMLKDRKYNDGSSYEQLRTGDKGYLSFESVFSGEDLYVHYSTLDAANWGIMLGRFETQVFESVHQVAQFLMCVFLIMALIVIGYIAIVIKREREKNHVTTEASGIRKLLLEINQQNSNIFDALKKIQENAVSIAAFFVDTDNEDYHYTIPGKNEYLLQTEEKTYLIGEIFRYAAKLHNHNKQMLVMMRVVPNEHMLRTNPDLYHFMNKYALQEIAFSAITEKDNHVSVLGVINPKKSKVARALIEDIAVCFSIAIFNKKHLHKTETAATTDSLTGVANRVSYKKDILELDRERPDEFSCIYIDVNELHLRNNKYGHAAGDEMLIYIANTLKEVFYGHRIYRMGGDEFLVFAQNTNHESIKQNIESFIEQLQPREYHVAIGLSYRSQNTNCEEMVREAEIRMYEAKARYYQNKELTSVSRDDDDSYSQIKTGIREIDTMLSVLKEHYNGIYRVSLETDNAHRILMPSYLGYNEDEKEFSALFKRYVDEVVHPDFARAMMSFLNYEAIRQEIKEGNIPRISYKKINGETVILSVYQLDHDSTESQETLWVFAKD